MNKEILTKGIRTSVLSLPLLMIGPAIIHNAWINKQNHLHYVVLAIGLAVCGVAVYFLWKGIMTILKALYND